LDDGNLRPVQKSALGNLVKETVVYGPIPHKLQTIIDGGHLFYTVLWENRMPHREIMNRYVKYVKFHYPDNENTFIIFDGYLTSTTKDMAHRKPTPIEAL
jgi:hypothetical protein